MKISDFNVGVADNGLAPSIRDFNPKRQSVTGLNQPTIKSAAAYASVLGDSDNLLRNYSQITNELQSGTASITLDNMLKSKSEFDYAANLDALRKVLADPNISTEDKARYTQGFANLTAQPLGSKSLSVSVGEAARIAPSDPVNDNDETEWVRLNTDLSLDEVDAYAGWAQQQLNAMNAASDPSMLRQLVDLGETIIPFMEQAAQAKVRQGFEDGLLGKSGAVLQSLTLMGESKESIRKALFSLPPAERVELAQKVIDYVKQSGGSITLRPNEMMMFNQLQDYLINGSYTGTDRFVDSLFSVLDLGVFVTPLFKAVKGTASLARIGERAAAAEERLAKVAPQVDEIVDSVAPVEVAPLDNIINGIRGFDKATADEIADARNTIGRGLEEGLDVEEIISNTKAFDKFNADEIAQARQVISTPAAHTTAPLSDEVLTTTSDMIGDRIVDSLGDLDEVPYKVYQDIRNAVKQEVTSVAMTNPKQMSKNILKRTNDVLKQNGVTAINKELTKKLVKTINTESNLVRRSVKSSVDPTSLSQTMKEVNPGKARSIHTVMSGDETGQLADVLYNTTRSEALANDLLPEVKEAGGSVRNKPEMDVDTPDPDMGIVNQFNESRGFTEFSDAEKTNMRNLVIQDFKALGLNPRRAMTTIGDNYDIVKGRKSSEGIDITDSGVNVDMVLGPIDGGYRSPKQARDLAKRALSKYGVRDDEIELVTRQSNGDYAPATEKSLADGDYLVRVKYNYEFSPADTLSWTLTSTNKFWRMFDTTLVDITGKWGGLAQQFIPHTAIQDNLLLTAASVASDRSAWINKGLLELAGNYAKSYNKLDKRQKALVDSYIIEANNLSLPFDPLKLKARGLSDSAVDTVRSWKKVWDTHYYFENLDLNKTLRARGYQQFVDSSNNTSFIVRQIGNIKVDEAFDLEKEVGNVIRQLGTDRIKAFDSGSNSIVELTKPDLVKLYNKGGVLGEARRPIDVGGEHFDYVIIKNNGEDNYLRRIRNDDQTLNYRPGHYTIYYNQPYFITKEVIGDGGKVYRKAVGSAETLKDANALADRLRLTDEGGTYAVRGDVKRGTAQYEDFEWDEKVSGGRTSQRVRGKQLVNGSGIQTDAKHTHIESPEESLVHAIRSVAHRTAFRDYIEAAKTRFTAQFGDLLPKEKGLRQWPEDIRSIGGNAPNLSRSRLTDARNTWRYIEAMDSGYVNLLDDWSKDFFKKMSQTFGRQGWGWMDGIRSGLEKGSMALSTKNPTAYARKKAFRFLLAANPLRQLPVQAMQALPVVLATNPKMLLTGRLPAQFLLVNYINRGGDVESFMQAASKMATGLSTEEAKKLVKDYELSGFEAAVKANSLIRDDLKRLVDRGLAGRVKSISAAPLNFTQRVGFEAGENALMRSVWLSEYDLLRSSGVKITPTKLEELNARVRNLTLNMNKAGELPYNENSFSALMQFFQAPHKAFAQVMLGHNGLTAWDRARLGTSYILTYGVGGGFVLDYINKNLQVDSKTKELIEGGFFNLLMNKALSTLYGEEVRTDFSDSLRLLQFPDLSVFIKTVAELNMQTAISSSPSASLVIGDNPKITNFVKQIGRVFTATDSDRPQEMMNTATSFLNIFSGASNFFKARYILSHGKSMSTSGRVIDFHVNEMEAILKAGGFSTIDEVHQFAFDEATYKATEAYKKDIDLFLTESSRRLAVEGISNDETEYYLRIAGDAQRVFENDPFYMKEILDQLFYKSTRGEDDILQSIIRLSGFSDEATLRGMIATAPVSEADKDQLYRFIESIKGAQ